MKSAPLLCSCVVLASCLFSAVHASDEGPSRQDPPARVEEEREAAVEDAVAEDAAVEEPSPDESTTEETPSWEEAFPDAPKPGFKLESGAVFGYDPTPLPEPAFGMWELGLDVSQEWVSQTVDAIAVQVDSFFGDELEEEELQENRLRVRLGYEFAERNRSEFVRDIKLDLDLPGTRKRWKLFFDATNEDDLEQSVDPLEAADSDEERSTIGGLRYVLRATDAVSLSADAGAKLRYPAEPFVRLRARKTFKLSESMLVRPTQWVFWESDEGFGTTSRVDLDVACFEESLFRFRQKVEISEESNGIEFDTILFFFDRVGARTGYRFLLAARGQTEPETLIRRYEASVRFRKNIHRNWLFLEIEPNVNFFWEDDYAPSLGVAIVLEANFGAF